MFDEFDDDKPDFPQYGGGSARPAEARPAYNSSKFEAYEDAGSSNGQKFQRDPNKPPAKIYKPYAISIGVGQNESIPTHIEEEILAAVKLLQEEGYTARVSVTSPLEIRIADMLTEKEVYLPWKGFGDKEGIPCNGFKLEDVAKKYHSGYDKLKPTVQAMLKRNAGLFVGKANNSPVLFLLCYSKDGAETYKERNFQTGYIYHPLSIAFDLRIPVFNFGKPDARTRLTKRYTYSARPAKTED